MSDDLYAKRLVDALTERQKEVACLLAEGLTEAEVAERLFRSEHTMHEHVRHIYERLDCRRRTQLVALVTRSGICEQRPKK